MGRLNYENIILKARLDHAAKLNNELLDKVQELEGKLIESKEGKGSNKQRRR
ncbi:hypothetical protein M3205_06155 [Cytobacillus firmus]|uniref:hypothetical protein n=1 Tax=Cytobacillus firmus TaxID=1399 RepID=UPI00203D5F9B|nr:hypothetical protein [Cytobacillus firmus]MCM3705310.1 hypothetical protein [Cytobacillus firmus]